MNNATYINLPASKSISNRVLIIEALMEIRNSKFEIRNLSKAKDTQLLQNILAQLSTDDHSPSTINAGMAGTAYRFLTAFLSIQNGEFSLTGAERMKQRPIKPLVDALQTLGGDITYLEKEGFPPLNIKGKPLTGGEVMIDGSISSQFITALMLIAPYLKHGLTINIIGKLVSFSYVKMTAEIMQFFEAEVELTKTKIVVAPKPYQPKRFEVENDWSSASYFYACSALHRKKIVFENLKPSRLLLGEQYKDLCSLQGDSILPIWFLELGVKSIFEGKQLFLNPISIKNNYIKLNCIENPDLAQTVVALCIGLEIQGEFTGLETLRIKETDRIAALQNEVAKFGYSLKETKQVYYLKQNTRVAKEEIIHIETYNDHRMAMAFAPLKFIYKNLEIENPNVVEKSFPNFWDEFRKCV